VRIAKAVKENRWNRVKALQYLLTRSFYAMVLAVKRVTSNKGKKTPGVDGVLWQGARARDLYSQEERQETSAINPDDVRSGDASDI